MRRGERCAPRAARQSPLQLRRRVVDLGHGQIDPGRTDVRCDRAGARWAPDTGGEAVSYEMGQVVRFSGGGNDQGESWLAALAVLIFCSVIALGCAPQRCYDSSA
jgi:hypothetical protein